MPVHMKVQPLIAIYLEDSFVDYYCEFSDMILVGEARRRCHQSRWLGDIPQCVKELPRRSLAHIEIENYKNHTVTSIYQPTIYDYNYLKTYQKYQAMTFYGNPSRPAECIHAKFKLDTKVRQWIVRFKWELGQVYYIQIVVNTDNIKSSIDVHKNDSIISGIYVSDYRVCKSPEAPQPVDTNEKLFKYTFICDLKDQSNVQKIEDFQSIRSEEVMNITIDFAVNDVIVCELHISETLPIRYYSRGSCGSPDIPLFSKYEPVFDDTSNGVIPVGYNFVCDPGFRLNGNQVVTCGVNNQWLDKFPTCLPTNTCPTMDVDKLEGLSLYADYPNLYSEDGINTTAINGSQAIYSCKIHSKGDDFVNKTMLGDSIQFCQSNGNWSGQEPVCIDNVDFTFYLAELNEDVVSGLKHPDYAHHLHQVNQCGIPAIPKYAKLYTYDPDLISVYFSALKGKLDLMPSYPNGSIMTYGCESKMDYMASDFGARTCVNGSWIGPIGKCFTPVGGTEVAKVISIQENSGSANVSYHQIQQDKIDKFWSYVENDDSSCVKLEIKSGEPYTWTIYLSASIQLSYFAVRFSNTKIFHDIDEDILRVHRASQLTKPSPITANLVGYSYVSNKLDCDLTKVIETGSSSGLTQVSFRCDRPDSHDSAKSNKRYQAYYGYESYTNAINIVINPDQFHESFDSTNTTHVNFCGLMLFKSSDDCGLPEEVPNSEIISTHGEGYVRYKCNPGYKLVGNEYVRCSKFGNWMDEFPRCELYKLCEMIKPEMHIGHLQRSYFNTLVIDSQEVAVLGTIIEFKCLNERLSTGKNVLVGPRSIVCTKTGQWSTKEPICADDAYFGQFDLTENSAGHSNSVAVPVTICILVVTLIICLAGWLYYRSYGFSNPILTCMTSREHTRRSSTFISYGQSGLRDSTISYGEDSLSSNNNNNNNNNIDTNDRINANLIKI